MIRSKAQVAEWLGLSIEVRVIGTEMTRKLGPLIASSGLRLISQETRGVGGLGRIALARKG